MKVIYTSMVTDLRAAISHAEKRNRTIDYVEMTKTEFADFLVDAELSPLYSRWIGDGHTEFEGVKIRVAG